MPFHISWENLNICDCIHTWNPSVHLNAMESILAAVVAAAALAAGEQTMFRLVVDTASLAPLLREIKNSVEPVVAIDTEFDSEPSFRNLE